MPVALDLPAAETAIIERTNSFRADNKLAPVRPNAKLTAAARAYAQKLARAKELSHTLDGTTPAQRIRSAGYSYCQVGENLASLLDTRGFTPGEYARRAVEGWENSPGHRANMLLPHVTETGVGLARSATTAPQYVAVQLFARPEAAKYKFKIVNETGRSQAYEFGGDEESISPREIITHGACVPGNITFESVQPKGRYEASDGQVYTLTPRAGGGVAVQVSR